MNPWPMDICRAARRLDTLVGDKRAFACPVKINKVRIMQPKWFFDQVETFDGFCMNSRLIFIRPGYEYDNDLLTHELCHVWQIQQSWPFKVALAFLVQGYEECYFEKQARWAAAVTRAALV